MLTMDSETQTSWEDFLNPDVMRNRLIAASIYIAGFEGLKDAIIERVREFFGTSLNNEISPKYKSEVLSRNRSEKFACIDWLNEMAVIDKADVDTFDRLNACRNRLAHELFSFLGTRGMPPDFEQCFQEMVALLRKIEVWWIVNVEIPTNPDFDGKEIDEDEIMPRSLIRLQLLCDIALGDEKKSQFYFEEFHRRAGH